jgi:peptidyl-prolyl cis-trans isomerase A (cyclophilin A)
MMTARYRILISIVPLLLLAACSETKQQKPEEAPKKRLSDRAPDVFKAKFETSKGDFVVEVHRDWAPHGADRFYNLIEDGFFKDVRFHRVVRNFIVQWGINGDPAISRLWSNLYIPDDPPKEKNKKGTITFATRGPATRSTQVFINLRDNGATLDKSGFVPFGRVIEGMDVVEGLYSYGDMPPRGNGPDPSQAELQGNKYLEEKFPRLDYIKKVSILPATP